MDFEKEIREIKKILKTEKPRFEAKIQQMGQDRIGKDRFILYITGAVKALNLKKGERVSFTIEKVDYSKKEEPEKIEDDSQKPEYPIQEPQKEIKKETTQEKKAETSQEPIDENEQIFLNKYKDAMKMRSPSIEFIKKNAMKQFGIERVEYLISAIQVPAIFEVKLETKDIIL